jgi:diadenylate cyclase
MFAKAGQLITEHWREGVEVLVIAGLFYVLYRAFRRVRGARIIVEILVVLAGLIFASKLLDFKVLHWLLSSLSLLTVLGLIVIFAPELRRSVVQFESLNLFARRKERLELADELGEIARQLSAKRFGALLAVHRGFDLSEFVETGVRVDAELLPELVLTIFHPKTVLHDGGAVIKDGRIEGAACVFPVSQRELADRSVGLRHRAALGLSEETDAIVLVVSEETGHLSIAHEGELERNLEPDEFVSRLRTLLASAKDDSAAE